MKKQGRLRVGSRIRYLRKKNSEKQRDIAEIIKVSGSQVAKIEAGNADAKASAVLILANKYDTYAETFFNEDGKMPSELIKKIIRLLGM